MKQECSRTRKMLGRYLRGHVFAHERKRIEQHLAVCPLCASELHSLKFKDETTQFLKDITPPEGIKARARAGMSALSSARTILYRPLWVVGLVAIGYLAFHYLISPYQQEQERQWRELSAPSASSTAPSAPAVPAATLPAVAAQTPAEPAAAPSPAKQPAALVATIAVEDEHASIRKINDVMRAHGALRSKLLTETTREVAGELTPKELQTLFNRIETLGRVSYSRKRLEAAPSAQPLPFILKVLPAPKPSVSSGGTGSGRSAAKPAAQPIPQPATPAAPNQPQTPQAP